MFKVNNKDTRTTPLAWLKHVAYVAYMLKIISLTGTPHNDKFSKKIISVPQIGDFFC